MRPLSDGQLLWALVAVACFTATTLAVIALAGKERETRSINSQGFSHFSQESINLHTHNLPLLCFCLFFALPSTNKIVKTFSIAIFSIEDVITTIIKRLLA